MKKKYDENDNLQPVSTSITKKTCECRCFEEMSKRVTNMVACGSKSGNMNDQRHNSHVPASLKCEVTVTPIACLGFECL